MPWSVSSAATERTWQWVLKASDLATGVLCSGPDSVTYYQRDPGHAIFSSHQYVPSVVQRRVRTWAELVPAQGWQIRGLRDDNAAFMHACARTAWWYVALRARMRTHAHTFPGANPSQSILPPNPNAASESSAQPSAVYFPARLASWEETQAFFSSKDVNVAVILQNTISHSVAREHQCLSKHIYFAHESFSGCHILWNLTEIIITFKN